MKEIIAHRPRVERTQYLPQRRILSSGQVLALRLSARASRRENSKERREVELPEAKRRAKFMVLMSTPNGATQEF